MHNEEFYKLRKDKKGKEGTIQKYLNMPIQEGQEATITKLLVKAMICKDLQPFSIVEDEGFR